MLVMPHDSRSGNKSNQKINDKEVMKAHRYARNMHHSHDGENIEIFKEIDLAKLKFVM